MVTGPGLARENRSAAGVKRIALAAISTLAALIALFSYPTSTGQSGSATAQEVSTARVVTGSPPTAAATTTGQGPDPAVPAQTTAAAPASTAVTVDGAAEMTRYGLVQVQVVITGGVITDVTAPQSPHADRESTQINSRAIPQLRAQVLKAQSANIDGVSGATFTTQGYITSLQSALDAAGLHP